MSLARALAWSLFGTLAAPAFSAWLWKGSAGVVVGGLLAPLRVILVFAYRDARKDDLALLEYIRGRISQQDRCCAWPWRWRSRSAASSWPCPSPP